MNSPRGYYNKIVTSFYLLSAWSPGLGQIAVKLQRCGYPDLEL
jgi:hypothetical protein